MFVRYSQHAIHQMSDRGISEEAVQHILDRPTWEIGTARNVRYDGIWEGVRIGVVVSATEVPVVVTVFYVTDRE